MVQELRAGPITLETIKCYLPNALEYFKAAAEVWQMLGDHAQVIQIFGILGNIYGTLGSNLTLLENYENALDLAERANNSPQKFRLF